MKNKKFKFLRISLWLLSLCTILFLGIIVSVRASNFAIPEVDVTYNSDNNWEGTLEINENKTVKISGVTHSNEGASYGSAIKISGNSTVNLVFEGENILFGNSGVESAGIEVEEGSTVNIYGIDGSSLYVTGGKYGAGIGGIGYSSVSATNPKAGNVIIYSGNITAIGGARGAGIGSGYHSSASNIEIKGGNITALGTGCGAGIGSGYGTSGGDSAAAGVGFYSGGNITISGGTVKAAAYHMDFDDFDPYNTKSLYGEGYSDTFAAGVGGGYGASSGNIIIEGDADVIAIGSCGGAGIGSGRGTSVEGNYDPTSFYVNIMIRGSSKVVSMTTDDRRTNVFGDDGGAAIGLGRGCTLKGEPKGTIKIEGNASVYAVAPDHAQAIGGSCVVGRFVKDAEGNIIRPDAASVEEITIGSGTIVTAISDGYRASIDHADDPYLANFLLIDFDDSYFKDRGDFFTEDKFPLKIETVDKNSAESKTMFAIQKPKKLCLMVYVTDVSKYNFLIKDYQGERGEKIFISNLAEKNSAQFFSDSTKVKKYDVTGLTARLDRDEIIEESKYGGKHLNIRAKEGIFEYGSSLFCNAITDKTVINELNTKLDKKYSDNLERIFYFDIEVEDRKGERYNEVTSEKFKVYVELPDGWDKDETVILFVKLLDDEDFNDSQKLETIDGVTYLSFETDHLGRYVLVDPIKKVEFFPTGDNTYFRYIVLISILIVSLFLVFMLSGKSHKKFRK